MSEIDATLIKDGQKVVATVSQSGTIISDPSAVDATALVQTDDGPQLCVKTIEMGEGGGGGGSVDQTYDATSTNAQSGTAVAEAVAPYLKNKATANSSLLVSLLAPDTTTGSSSVVITNSVTSPRQNGTQAVCLGDGSGYYSYTTSVGIQAQTSNAYCTAIGNNSFATGGGAQGNAGTAIGNMATANNGTSVGAGTNASAKAIVVGASNGPTQRVQATAYKAIVMGVIGASGETCEATAQQAIQLGNGSNANAKTFQVYEYQLLDGNTGKIPAERLPVKHRFCTEGQCSIDKSVIPWLSTNQPFVFTFSFRTPPLKNFVNGQAIVITGNTHYDIGFELVMDWEDANETKARLGVGLTTANSTWNLGWTWSEYLLEPLTWYKVRLSYDLTKYTVECAPDNSDSWTTIKEATSSDKLYCNTDIFLTQQSNNSVSAIWKYGEVDINSFKATSGNTTYIDGIYSLRNLITLPVNSYQVKEYYEIG